MSKEEEVRAKFADVKEEEFASVADLLSSGEKTVFIKSLKKNIKIKKLPIGIVADIVKLSKGDDVESGIQMTFCGLVHPKLSLEEVRKMDPIVFMEIAKAVTKFSGLDKTSMEQAGFLKETE